MLIPVVAIIIVVLGAAVWWSAGNDRGKDSARFDPPTRSLPVTR